MFDSTHNLQKELQEISKTGPKPPYVKSTYSSDNVHEKQDDLEHLQILFVELAYLLNAFLKDTYYWEGVKTGQKNFNAFIHILEDLDQKSVNANRISVKFRGLYSAKVPDHIDYLIECGGVTLDIACVISLIKRLGIRYKHLEGRLRKAFEAFSSYGLSSLVISIPEDSDVVKNNLRISINIFSQFNKAIENDTKIVFKNDDGDRISINPICDENNQPDFNLTLVAAINGLNTEVMNELVQKVAIIQNQLDEHGAANHHPNVYQTIFNIAELGQKLEKPLIEINFKNTTGQAEGRAGPAKSIESNTSQLGENDGGSPVESTPEEESYLARADTSGVENSAQLESEQELSQGAINAERKTAKKFPTPALNPHLLKAFITKMAKIRFKSSPKDARQAVYSIYGNDYNQIDTQSLCERIKYINDLLAILDQNPKALKVMQGLTERLNKVMAQMPEDVLNDVAIDGEELKIWSNDRGSINTKVNKNILDIIATARKRSNVRKKKIKIPNIDRELSDADYHILSDEFNIKTEEIKKIIHLFEGCLNEHGHFVRKEFEKRVKEFAQYGKTIFSIIWKFLKDYGEEKNCFSFLNALQILVEELQQPIDAIKILLANYCLDPKNPTFEDRMAIMLSSQFIRKYNKERHLDIELTPEEVLRVENGLNRRAIEYAKWKINGEKKAFIQKAIAIREHLQEFLSTEPIEDISLNIRSLLALEREIYIFLSLVGGQTSYVILRDALGTYGDPKSPIYQQRESHLYATALIQHLTIVIRGFGRLGKPEDIAFLEDVKAWQEEFLNLKTYTQHDDALARKVINLISQSIKDIQSHSENNNQKNSFS